MVVFSSLKKQLNKNKHTNTSIQLEVSFKFSSCRHLLIRVLNFKSEKVTEAPKGEVASSRTLLCPMSCESSFCPPLSPLCQLIRQIHSLTAGPQSSLSPCQLFTEDLCTLTTLSLDGNIREEAPSNKTSHPRPGVLPVSVAFQFWKSRERMYWLRQVR